MSNQIDQDALDEAVKAILSIEDQMASDKGAYMKKCAGNRGAIQDLKATAKDNGIPTKPFNATLKRKKLMNQVEQIAANMDDDEAELLDQMELKLGWASNDNEALPEAA